MFSPLLRKGLLIVLVPFAVNLVWIGLFWGSLQGSLALTTAISKDGDVILLVSRGMALLAKLIINASDYVKAAGDQDVKEKVESEGFALLAILKKLGDATANDADTHALAENLLRSVASFEGEIRTIAAAPNPLDIDYQKSMPRQRFAHVISNTTELLSIMKTREESLRSNMDLKESQQSITRMIAMVGLSLNLLMALALVFIVHRDIAARVSELARRAHLLTSVRYEEKEMSGNDELNDLDRELLFASRQLQAAYQFRQTFMSIMAKRLQVPLRECIRASELLAEENSLHDEAGANQLASLRSSTSACLSLIDDMLLLESLEGSNLNVDLHECDITAVIDSAIAIIANLAERKNLSIEKQIEPAIIKVDQARIRQVLVNILSNAVKFSPHSAVITVKCSRTADSLRIAVTDQGPGIDRQMQSQLFQKFFQSTDGKKAGGTGLGLAIARLIVDAHHGQIGVDSTPGKGSTFWLSLPL